MTAYYNENDPFAADWLENLIECGLITAGDVDRRSITEVCGDDVSGYTQCHFFAGIGGWPLALRLAGWPDDVPVWTGSCPCQPFSAAGKHKGTADKRHLWPDFRRLIGHGNPADVFGEQVASKDGRLWLSGVRVDMEALGYAFGAADLCAAGVNSPHIRQRLYWSARGASDAELLRTWNGEQRVEGRAGLGRDRPAIDRATDAICNGVEPGLEGHSGNGHRSDQPGRQPTDQDGPASASGAWAAFRVVEFRDGKSRRIPLPESGVFPLAHGIPRNVGRGGAGSRRLAAGANRKGRLRGYGNAIVPQLAAEFVSAYIEATANIFDSKTP